MPGCIVSAMTASFRSVEKRRRRATPVITSTFENVSDIGVCLGLYLGPPAKAGVRSKQGAVQRLSGLDNFLVLWICLAVSAAWDASGSNLTLDARAVTGPAKRTLTGARRSVR